MSNTITIKVTETVEREESIALPHYNKWGNYYYKVLTAETAIGVYDAQDFDETVFFGDEIKYTNTTNNFLHKDRVKITESEFMEVYNRVSEKLDKLARGE